MIGGEEGQKHVKERRRGKSKYATKCDTPASSQCFILDMTEGILPGPKLRGKGSSPEHYKN